MSGVAVFRLMACHKQQELHQSISPMNSKNIALLLAASGLLVTGVLAENNSVLPVSATALGSVTDAASGISSDLVQSSSVNQIIASEYRYNGNYETRDEASAMGSSQSPLAEDSFPAQSINRRMVFAMTPAPIVPGDPSGPTSYFASVAFQFNLSRVHHS